MARAGEKWDDECCAVHDGTIANFESLAAKLREVSDWRTITTRSGTNIVRVGKIAGGTIVGGLLGASGGWIAAPAIGGAIGTVSGLTGAAAISHGLAVLGGGSLAAGGMGVAGGALIVGVTAGALGSHAGGVLVNKYVRDIKGFDVRLVQRGRKTSVICVDGFLCGDKPHIDDWTPGLAARFPSDSWYQLAWESKTLRDIGTLVSHPASAALHKSIHEAASRATKLGAGRFGLASLPFTAASIAGNPWWVGLKKAQHTGHILADLILRTDARTQYILVGHSLGARVIYYALQALAESRKSPRIRAAHLLGGAVGNDASSWNAVSPALKGKVYNYYSSNDQVLNKLYRAGTLFQSKPIGSVPIDSRSNHIANIDVSSVVCGHTEYKAAFPLFANA